MANISYESEKELEDYICKYMSDHGINPINGAGVYDHYSQCNIGLYGIADIVASCIYPHTDDTVRIVFNVIEVKKEKLKPDSVAQLSRYMVGLAEHLKSLEIGFNYIVTGILIAPSITEDTKLLVEKITEIDAYTVRFDLEFGVEFNLMTGCEFVDPEFGNIEDFVSLSIDEAEILKKSLLHRDEIKNVESDQKEVIDA